MRHIKKLLALLLILGCALPGTAIGEEHALGNTSGNIRYFGRLARDEEWIYESFSEDGLYRMRAADGSEREKIFNQPVSFLNVIDGYLYFAAGKDDRRTIRRMKTDGSDDTRLAQADAYTMYALDGWLYYEDLTLGTLARIPMDGGEPEPFGDLRYKEFLIHSGVLYAMRYPQGDPITVDRFALPSLERTDFPHARRIAFAAGDWLYDAVNDSPQSPFRRVNDAGETGKEFSHFGAINLPFDGKVYTTDRRATVKGGSHDGANAGYISAFDLETGGQETLVELYCLSFNVVEDWIAYWFWDTAQDDVMAGAFQMSTGTAFVFE